LHPPIERTFGCVLLCSVLFLAGCERGPSHKTVIASVGSAELTEEDIAATGDSVWKDRRRSSEFINEWVMTELLYQEATRRGLASSDEVLRQLESARKHLAIAALLDREVFKMAEDTVASMDSARAYFHTNESMFTLTEDVALISLATFGEREQANAFRSVLLRGGGWDGAIAALGSDNHGAPAILQVVRQRYVTASSLYPPELWKLARTLARDEPSYAVKTDQGYHILQVHGYKRQGEVPDFDFVREDIQQRFLIERRRSRYDAYVNGLRQRRELDIHVVRPDTLSGSSGTGEVNK
jgi:hypothetical protein